MIIAPTETKISKDVRLFVWANLNAGDQGAEVDVTDFSRLMFQAAGTFAGATAKPMGSIIPGAFHAPIDFGAPGIALPNFRFLRLRIDLTGGDIGTNVTVALLAST